MVAAQVLDEARRLAVAFEGLEDLRAEVLERHVVLRFSSGPIPAFLAKLKAIKAQDESHYLKSIIH